MKLFYKNLKILFLLSGFFLILQNCFAQLTLTEWNFPNNPDNSLVDISVPVNAAQTISTQGGTGALAFNTGGALTNAASCNTWTGGANTKWWEITLNTTGYYNLEFSSKQTSSNTGPRDFKAQYRIGAGAWTDFAPVPTVSIIVQNSWTNATHILTNVALPVSCENQAAISIRWIMTSNTSVTGGTVGNLGTSRIDDINISSNDVNNHFRSIASGSWNNPNTWESSPDLLIWTTPALTVPSRYSKTININSPHTITINSNASMDELIIQNGAVLNYSSGLQTINDGTGVDFQVDGTFNDAGGSSTVWSGAAPRWALGANGTYIKSATTSAQTWRDNYNISISNIPATANWYIRKTGAALPSLTTVGNMHYPNLIIENVSGGNWACGPGSIFTGNSNFATIKGNFDIGGTSGLGTVDFMSDNTNTTCIQVQGNMFIRSGSALRNNGTGFELYSNLTVDGSASYDANDARRFKFSGGASQIISGTGTLNAFGVYQLQMTKSGNDLTLNRPVKVNGNLDLQTGIINSSSPNFMVIEDNGTATSTNNASFVRGPVRKLGDETFTFPVGKNNDYQAIGYSAGPPPGGPFWTETFSNNNNSNNCCSGNYNGANGTWTLNISTGANDGSWNPWRVTCEETFPGVGNCGVACGSNATLHVSNSILYPFFSGAAYYDGPGGNTNMAVTSPIINTAPAGSNAITLGFDYISFGETGSDYSSIEYSINSGVSWTTLESPIPQTTCCGAGGCILNSSNQGRWASRSYVLPLSCSNIVTFQLRFLWTNDADGQASDPSFAVDNIVLSVPLNVEQFTAEYFYNNPQIPYGNILLPNLVDISNCEYWILTRDIGASNRLVTLTFDANSCGFQTTPADLLVANYNTGDWYDRGNGGFTATTVTTAAPQNVYGPFTLGSIVPLPVELVYFDAKYNGKAVDLTWTTASEINNDFFIVERTKYGEDFSVIAKVKGAGTSTSVNYYKAEDNNPLKGTSYYRLKQTDFNGENSFSRLVPVQIENSDFGISYLYPDQAQNEIYFQLKNTSGKLKAEVIDVTGRIIISQELNVPGENNIFRLNSLLLKSGIYTFRISDKSSVLNRKFSY